MEEMQNYLSETFGETIRPKVMRDQSHKLPLYLQGNYDIYLANLSGNQIILAEVNTSATLTPDQLKKQGDQLEAYLNKPVVFVFEHMESWLRKRLIAKHVGFAEPFQQLYIPSLLLQLKNQSRSSGKPLDTNVLPSSYLSSPAQCLLLYHLQVEPLTEKSFRDLSDRLEYSSMTITRAVKELTAFNFAEVKGRKEKHLHFMHSDRQLWEHALPHLQSPVREFWFFDNISIDQSSCRISGDTALSAYTMLAETSEKSFSVGKDVFRGLRQQHKIDSLYKHSGPNKLEVWHYSPLLLSEASEADKLSVYLSKMHDTDERVQGALKELINSMVWL